MKIVIDQKSKIEISEQTLDGLKFFEWYFPVDNSNDENKKILLNDVQQQLSQTTDLNPKLASTLTLKEAIIENTSYLNTNQPTTDARPTLIFAGIFTNESGENIVCVQRIYSNGTFKPIWKVLNTKRFNLKNLNINENYDKSEEFFNNTIDGLNKRKTVDNLIDKSDELKKKKEETQDEKEKESIQADIDVADIFADMFTKNRI